MPAPRPLILPVHCPEWTLITLPSESGEVWGGEERCEEVWGGDGGVGRCGEWRERVQLEIWG